MAVPVALRGHRAGQARGLDDDIGSVVHSRFGVVAERQPVALDLTGVGGETTRREKEEYTILYHVECQSVAH